jgi:RNA polymerase sigma factor (sigma-70 family)
MQSIPSRGRSRVPFAASAIAAIVAIAFLPTPFALAAQEPEEAPPEGSTVIEDEVVVTATASPRSRLEVAQPTNVLSDEDLVLRADTTLGETLDEELGVSSTYFGPGASRPVIRGLGGDRIRVLESGIGGADASSASPDHAVSSDPLTAERIEVIRGPATLLYGSSAVGGVVNVLSGRIPSYVPEASVSGELHLVAGSVADERSGAAVLEGALGSRVAWHADYSNRETGDSEIPGFAEVNPEEGEEAGILVLRLVGGSEADAEDVVQDCWLRAAQNLSEFRWVARFSTWLTGIGINLCRERVRRSARRRELLLQNTVPPTYTAPANEDRVDLERAIELLPDGYRQVLILHDVEGFTHGEIGDRLGIAEGTSKSQLFFARKAMRRMLAPGPEKTNGRKRTPTA